MSANIRASACDINLNLLGRSNVSHRLQLAQGEKVYTNLHLYRVLDKLTVARPNWRFIGTGQNSYSNGTIITNFLIAEDDETLGTVGIEWKGRNYKIKVRNERIDAKRERGNGYFTEDEAKAELAIRKHFYRRGVSERIEVAQEQMRELVRKEEQLKSYHRRDAHIGLMVRAHKFVRANLTAYIEAYPEMTTRAVKYNEAKAQHEVVLSMKQLFDNGKATLVVSDGTQYLLKTGALQQTCTDAELTYDMRRKLGMLKLVQDKQMISDIGCRLDGRTFLLMPEDPAAEAETTEALAQAQDDEEQE